MEVFRELDRVRVDICVLTEMKGKWMKESESTFIFTVGLIRITSKERGVYWNSSEIRKLY